MISSLEISCSKLTPEIFFWKVNFSSKRNFLDGMNASSGNYDTHSTSASTETYLLQSQPNTKEILPTKKKTLISSTTLPPKHAKTQSS